VLALQATIDQLPASGRIAHNVKVITDDSLSLFAQSLAKRREAVGASPRASSTLLKEAQQLFMKSLSASATAGKLLGRGS
jgi:hypothetical protein